MSRCTQPGNSCAALSASPLFPAALRSLQNCPPPPHYTPHTQLNAKRITSLSISLAGGDHLQKDGEYRLGLDWIAARNTRLYEYEQLERGHEAGRGLGRGSSSGGTGEGGGGGSEGSSGTAVKGWWETK